MILLTSVLSLVLGLATTKHILLVFPITIRSTRIQLDPLIEGLLDQGHEVTAVFPFPSTISHSNYTERVIPDTGAEWYERFTAKVFTNEAGPDLNSFKTVKTMFLDDLNGLKQDYEILKLYDELSDILENNTIKIDALIVGSFLGNSCFYMAKLLNCPIIVFGLEGPQVGLMGNMGNPDNPSWQISNYSPFVEPMTFLQRLQNVLNRFLLIGFHKWHMNIIRNGLQEKYQSEIPDLHSMETEESSYSL